METDILHNSDDTTLFDDFFQFNWGETQTFEVRKHFLYCKEYE